LDGAAIQVFCNLVLILSDFGEHRHL
jgi:hypothetical protein